MIAIRNPRTLAAASRLALVLSACMLPLRYAPADQRQDILQWMHRVTNWQVGNERLGANKLFCTQTCLERYAINKDRAMIAPTIDWLGTSADNALGGGPKWYADRGVCYADSLYDAPALAMLAQATGDKKTIVVTVANRLDESRNGAIVELDWRRVCKLLPDAKPNAVAALADPGDAPFVTQAVDEDGDGTCEKLILRADFAPRQVRRFKIQGQPADKRESLVHALYTANAKIDYFAWENDRIAFRLYGPVTEKDLVSSGVDVWAKRVPSLILDTMIRRNYHVDNGEGVDCYKVGEGRGCGGVAVWKDGKPYVSRNFRTWKIRAAGRLRVVFDLNYDPWNVGGSQVGEVKRISLDAGSQLCRMESRLRFEGPSQFDVAAGLGIPKGGSSTVRPKEGWASVWQRGDGKDNGMLGVAVVMPTAEHVAIQQAEGHVWLSRRTGAGEAFVYYAGAGWDKFGFADAAAWNSYVETFARRLASPLEVRWEDDPAKETDIRP